MEVTAGMRAMIAVLLMGDAVLAAGLVILWKVRKLEKSYTDEISRRDRKIKQLQDEIENRIAAERMEMKARQDTERRARLMQTMKEPLK